MIRHVQSDRGHADIYMSHRESTSELSKVRPPVCIWHVGPHQLHCNDLRTTIVPFSCSVMRSEQRTISTRVTLEAKCDAQTQKVPRHQDIGSRSRKAGANHFDSLYTSQPQPWHAKQSKETKSSNSSSALAKPHLRRQLVRLWVPKV